MNKGILTTAAVAAVMLGGCGLMGGGKSPAADKASASSTALASKENAAAAVNGQSISKNALHSLITEIGKQANDQSVPQDKALESLIGRELLRQEAEKLNLQKNPDISGRLENVTRDVLAQAAVENFRKSAAVTDEDARKEYDSKLAGAELVEFKARHILLESEQEANDVLAMLKKGAKFQDLAKKYSKDPSAKETGGELGWFNPGQMIPDFTRAVAALKNGETTPSPVHTQFGWHIIQREDSRKAEVPPFDTIKEQLRNMLIGQKLQRHIEDLKNAAKIETYVSGKK